MDRDVDGDGDTPPGYLAPFVFFIDGFCSSSEAVITSK